MLHIEGFNCSESVLLAIVSEWGISSELIPRLATGFGGGMGRQGYVCGALAGGIMAIGIRYGRDKGSDVLARDKSYATVRELFSRFRTEFRTIECSELTGCDLTTPEGVAKHNLAYQDTCAKYIARVVELVLELTNQ
ncbi:MAG: hypothetical protein QG670_174 [Thermoproteota archaeon]|nr:hypothetical protein [Thermoproteota archaeon]